jgi:hypothetical protein
MLRKLLIVLFVSLPLLATTKPLTLAQVKKQESQQVGKIHFSKWFFSIYDATLLTQNGTFSWNKPFLLKIHYLRNISGKTIAKHTIQQIYEQHPMDVNDNSKEYSKVFNKLVPNVKKGSNLYGYMDQNGNGYLYSDSGLVGEIPSKKLSKYFFEIWLSDRSSNVKLSKELRGLL